MKLPYGYRRLPGGEIETVRAEADAVTLIFERYLSGDSLGKVANALCEQQIPSPAGKKRWTAAAIDNLLQNAKYIPIVGVESYFGAQFERDKHSRTDLDTGKRKTARYSSGGVLSGLLICGECGRSYRRVQRASGEIVWRCANRVEHGGKVCKNAPTVTEAEFHGFLRETLGVREIVPNAVKAVLDTVVVRANGALEAAFKQELRESAEFGQHFT